MCLSDKVTNFWVKLSKITIRNQYSGKFQVVGGSLYTYLQQNQNKISLKEKIINMCYGTAKGLQYLHENSCIHRDIASRNILYTEDKIVINFTQIKKLKNDS